MIRTLSPGENVFVTRERPTLNALDITVAWTAGADPTVSDTITACAFACDDSGTVPREDSMVFFNQPVSADGSVALTSSAPGRVTFTMLLPHVTFTRLVVAAYVSEGVGARRTLGQLGRLTVTASESETGHRVIATRDAVPLVRHCGAALLAEAYLRGPDWKFKATPDGFTDGMLALTTAMGVRV